MLPLSFKIKYGKINDESKLDLKLPSNYIQQIINIF